MTMKALVLTFFVACTVAFAVPAFAQTPQAQAEWSRILARRPELQRRPGLIFNQPYMKTHPYVNSFILAHPGIAQEVNRERIGSWDPRGQWRDPGWWHANDPDWMYDNHPEWARSHPEWRDDGDWDDEHHWHNRAWWVDNREDWVEQHHPQWREYGDWDDQHRWHDRDWWVDHHHDWVEQHHPGWSKHHEEPYGASNPGYHVEPYQASNPGHHEEPYEANNPGRYHEGDHGKGHHEHHGDHD
jgi:hypothetical protein